MLQDHIGSTRALMHLLDVLPESPGSSALPVLEGMLDRTRRHLVRRLNEEMNRLVAASCEEVAAITGLTPERFYSFSHPDCSERICRGSHMEILRIDRAVGGEMACLCRVFRRSRVTACALRPFRMVALSGRLENSRGLIELGQAVLVAPDEPILVAPGATFLLPHPMAMSLILHAIQAGFRLRTPRHGTRPLRLVSPPMPTDGSE
jgi:hypothetical protein